MTRVGTAVRMGAREYRRTPTLLVLLVLLPAYAIGVFTQVVPDHPVALHLAGDEIVHADLPAVVTVLMTPTVSALAAGITGLFVMRSTADADGRLVVTGYSPAQVVLARFCLLAGVSVAVSGVSMAMASVAVTPEYPALFFVGTVLAALVYSSVGILVGSLLSELAGVYVVLFGTLVDVFLFQNPLATEETALATIAPSHFPLSLAMDAGFGDTVALAPLLWGVGIACASTALATFAVYLRIRAA